MFIAMGTNGVRVREEEPGENMKSVGKICLARKTDSCALEPRKLSELALALGVPVGDYEIVYFNNSFHRYGVGGKHEQGESLERDGRVLLVRRSHTAWDTYTDDSEDHTSDEGCEVMLFEEDLLARKYFDSVEGEVKKG